MSQVRRAVIFSSITRYSVMLIGLVSMMAVARLLTPDEIGTFAIASGIVMLISEFRILGAGAYLVREVELTAEKVRAGLGLTILISWGLGFAILIVAPLAADFYELPPVATVFRILSLTFFLAPFISVPSALFSRDLKFNLLFRMQFFGAIVALVVTLSLIYAGLSFYSLAWGQVAGALSKCLIANLLLRPKAMAYLPSMTGVKAIASLGIFNSSAGILRKAVVVLPDMIIGKMGTTFEVGMFSRGMGFTQFVSETLMRGVSPVALPYLSGARREGGDVRFAYQRASVLLGGLVWPVLVVGSLASLPAIRLFFGDQWDAAAPLVAWLAIWAALRSVHWFSNDVLVAMHREKIMLIKDLVIFLLLVMGVIAAYPAGLERIAQVFMLVGFFEVFFITLVLRACIGLKPMAFASAWLPNLAIAAGCGVMTLVVRQLIDFELAPAWQPAVALTLVMPPLWLLLLYLLGHPLFKELRGVLLSFRRKK
ncbi:Membrane protein involved in the export of O-antigen and teichoic acid [Marinobacter daqiaonensis]|uniref:Membrane protein involved in the export of O-antigen and teichoic acid n=1 Tax=Marinobacter daqiaonensis TaxID=650891 RepID=A0A1I6HWA1_9GAMM|nr:oligosaccharide flippase family protein [Marinobacter daqiaonensis]SFR58731.1 Membrane protein involved in the export of O-antigen and teichoic acid [Marinobacter daqiaonensis]